MNIIKIPKKKKGEYREICCPSTDEKIHYRSFLSDLNDKAKKLCNGEIVHGFSIGKSPVTNAEKHIGKRFTLKFDLENFFDTIKEFHLKGRVKDEIIKEIMPNGRAYQGLPTSPVVANIAASKMDDMILKKLSEEIVYTRYADDLCFSFNDHKWVAFLKSNIPAIIGICGFKLNKSKTWLQDARFGNRNITGISVSDKVTIPRSIKRKLRAAKHHGDTASIKGLTEWSKLKLPQNRLKIDPYRWKALLKFWNLAAVNLNDLPHKETTDLGDNIIISGDPILICGLSNWTTNWSSCMKHPSGSNHRGAIFWLYSKGTRIAGLFTDNTINISGFERPMMKARALIHTFRSGKSYYDRIYGESGEAKAALQTKLEASGIYSVHGAAIDDRVSGNIPGRLRRPYFDNLSAVKSTSLDREVWVLKKK